MSVLKPDGVPISVGGKDYKLYFTLNAIDKIQTKYDRSISDLTDILGDKITGMGALRFVLTALINEGIDIAAETGEKAPHVTEEYIGRHALDNARPRELMQAVYAAFVAHNNTGLGGDDPNPGSE